VDGLSEHVENAATFGSAAQARARWRSESGMYAPGTIANDARDLAAFRRTELWGMRMDEVTPDDCRDALLWLKDNPVGGEGRLTNTTVNKFHIHMNAVFRQAVEDGALSRNPMASIPAPRPDTPEKKALDRDGTLEFLSRLDAMPLDGRTMALWVITLGGLRRGEACALLDSDVEGGTIHVRRAVKERDGSVAETKTRAGTRDVPMCALLSAKVDEWRDVRRTLDLDGAPTLCCNTRGGLLRPQNLHRWWVGDAKHNGVRESLGLDGWTLHELRHSNLTLMARHMSPFDLQRYAGWSSLAPAKVYIHDDMEAMRAGVADAWA
jgi:integrase